MVPGSLLFILNCQIAWMWTTSFVGNMDLRNLSSWMVENSLGWERICVCEQIRFGCHINKRNFINEIIQLKRSMIYWYEIIFLKLGRSIIIRNFFLTSYTEPDRLHLKILYLQGDPDSKVHGTNTGPTWILSAPDGPHVGPMNLAVRGLFCGTLNSVTQPIISGAP